MDTNGNILEYYRTIQRGHLVDTAPHHRSRYPAHHATLPETDLMGKTLHENLHGISERVDIHRVLHDVLRSARTPPYTRHLLGSDCSVVAMGFVYRLHSVRAQPEIQGTGGGTLCNAFPLPAPFVGTRNGISHDDHHRDALLGSSFTIGLLLAFSRRVNLLVILFLCHWALIAFSKVYIYKIPEDLLLASATVPAIYLFFKNYFEQNLHKETKLGARLMNWFLILICIVVGVLLSMTLLHGMRG